MKKYVVKPEIAENVFNLYHRKKYENELGLTKSYLSLTFSGKKAIKKSTAYALTKCTDITKEIEDYFDEV